MDIYESYRMNNFMLIYGVLIMHILHMLCYAFMELPELQSLSEASPSL